MRCTRACKSCHGENCLNSADIVDLNREDDDDDYENTPEDQNPKGIAPESEIIIKPGYLQIIQGIYGYDSDDDKDTEEIENDDRTIERVNKVSIPLPSTSDDQPSSKRRRKINEFE